MKRVVCENQFRREWSASEPDCDTLDAAGVDWVLVEAPETGRDYVTSEDRKQ